jgi:release factor glutamine methyltransferase
VVARPADAATSAIVGRLRAAGCVFAEDEARLLVGTATSDTELAAMVDRRVAGLPLEHVLGWAAFCGLRIIVGPGVFVPRRRSEFLVSQAVTAIMSDAGRDHGPVILDLCCGSGALGLAVATALRQTHNEGTERGDTELVAAELHAADIDAGAIAYARRNLAAIGGHVHVGDLYAALPADLLGRIDLIIVNAPYVPTSELYLMPGEARLHEPRVALDGGGDGVAIHRRVAAEAPRWLVPGGRLLIETSQRQAPLTEAAMAEAGLMTSVISDDEVETTVVTGRACPPLPP